LGRRTPLMLTAFLVCGMAANAAIYSFRDSKGRLFLTDSPPNNKYKIVVTTKKDRVGPDLPSTFGGTQSYVQMAPQKILLPNDETFSSYINQAARQYGVDPYLIKSVVKVESDFDPSVVSSKGARGLMQLIPSTARLVGCDNAFDPSDNIRGGAKYLKMMLDRFGGNLDHALAAYNSGPGRVDQYNGIPPFRETQNYVNKVKHYYRQFRTGLPMIQSYASRTVRPMPVVSTALSQKLAAAYRSFQNQDIEGAIRAYQEILNIYPRNTQALYNLACLHDQERSYDEAIDAYQASLREDPFLDKAIYNMAIIYERLGRHQEAIAAWRKYLMATKDEEKINLAERYVKELEEYAAINN